MVPVPVRPVGVAVLQLLGRGGADVAPGYVEVEGLPGQRVVQVDHDGVALHLADDEGHGLAVLALRGELQPGPRLEASRERLARDLLQAAGVAIPVALGRRHHHLLRGPRLEPLEGGLEARDDLIRAVQVRERVARLGRVHHLPVAEVQRVVDGDDAPLRDLHAASRTSRWYAEPRPGRRYSANPACGQGKWRRGIARSAAGPGYQ